MTETTAALGVLREPCQLCHIPMPLADLMFCRYGPGLKCADSETCNGRIERRIARLKAASAKFRALCSAGLTLREPAA